MTIVSLLISIVLIAASLIGRPLSFVEKRALISPPPNVEYFSFGYQMSIADSLWIRALQDFDYCENVLGKNLCEGNGWLAKMLDSITNLAPDYQLVYRTGGLALTILVSDYPGASKIFDKGVKIFPNDQQLLYRAGYHAMFEEKNNEKAAGLFTAAAKNGAPEWLYSLAVRLYSDGGRKELALKLYEQLKVDGTSDALLERMKKKIESSK